MAGYTALYKELDIFPEVRIAEEARECGSMAIFEDIISYVRKYNVMNDYTRTINTINLQVGCFNCDTAALPSLERREEVHQPNRNRLLSSDDVGSSRPGLDLRQLRRCV